MTAIRSHGTHFVVRVAAEFVQDVLRTGFSPERFRLAEGIPIDALLVGCEFDDERRQAILKFFSGSGHPFGELELTPIVEMLA